MQCMKLWRITRRRSRRKWSRLQWFASHKTILPASNFKWCEIDDFTIHKMGEWIRQIKIDDMHYYYSMNRRQIDYINYPSVFDGNGLRRSCLFIMYILIEFHWNKLKEIWVRCVYFLIVHSICMCVYFLCCICKSTTSTTVCICCWVYWWI